MKESAVLHRGSPFIVLYIVGRWFNNDHHKAIKLVGSDFELFNHSEINMLIKHLSATAHLTNRKHRLDFHHIVAFIKKEKQHLPKSSSSFYHSLKNH